MSSAPRPPRPLPPPPADGAEHEAALAELGAPLGQAGSGRRRYAAAMLLYARGQLSARALEAYRVSAARDSDDPGALMARWAPGDRPPEWARSPAVRRRALLAEIDAYLATLDREGVAGLRGALARATPAAGGNAGPGGNAGEGGEVAPGVEADPGGEAGGWRAALLPALAELAATRPALADAIRQAAPVLVVRPVRVATAPAEAGFGAPASAETVSAVKAPDARASDATAPAARGGTAKTSAVLPAAVPGPAATAPAAKASIGESSAAKIAAAGGRAETGAAVARGDVAKAPAVNAPDAPAPDARGDAGPVPAASAPVEEASVVKAAAARGDVAKSSAAKAPDAPAPDATAATTQTSTVLPPAAPVPIGTAPAAPGPGRDGAGSQAAAFGIAATVGLSLELLLLPAGAGSVTAGTLDADLLIALNGPHVWQPDSGRPCRALVADRPLRLAPETGAAWSGTDLGAARGRAVWIGAGDGPLLALLARADSRAPTEAGQA